MRTMRRGAPGGLIRGERRRSRRPIGERKRKMSADTRFVVDGDAEALKRELEESARQVA
jgi:hypothetical protein